MHLPRVVHTVLVRHARIKRDWLRREKLVVLVQRPHHCRRRAGAVASASTSSVLVWRVNVRQRRLVRRFEVGRSGQLVLHVVSAAAAAVVLLLVVVPLVVLLLLLLVEVVVLLLLFVVVGVMVMLLFVVVVAVLLTNHPRGHRSLRLRLLQVLRFNLLWDCRRVRPQPSNRSRELWARVWPPPR